MIREARATDLQRMREIERAADEHFRELGMDAIADSEPASPEQLAAYERVGRAWVAVDDRDRPSAFLLVDVVDRAAHIEQVSVHPECARRGVGARLIETAVRWAARHGLEAVTLMTFRDVPWNRPYYERLGFRIVDQAQLTDGLRALQARETALRLDRWPRVAMRRRVDVLDVPDPRRPAQAENSGMGMTSFTSRPARPADAASIAGVMREGFATYRRWAPADWMAPSIGAEDVAGLAEALGREDVWCLLALHEVDVIGHVALAPYTREEPGPVPIGTTYLWQLFVRPMWQGRGVATWLMERAVAEARERGLRQLLLWTPRGAAQARRFYEREGWSLTGRAHEHSGLGLPTVEYGRAADSSRSVS